MSGESRLAFSCQMCGECCRGEGGIVMDAGDRLRLADFLGVNEGEMLERYAEERHGKVLVRSDGTGCFFLSDKGCSVHPGRPNVCRAWPFFRGNLVDADSWDMAKEACPGISTSATHAEFVAQGRDYLQQHGLLDSQDAQTGRALWPEELPEALPEELSDRFRPPTGTRGE